MAGMEKNCNIDKWYQKSWFEILERYPTKRQEHIRKGWWSIVARIETDYCNMVKNIRSDTIRSFRSHIREIFHVVTHKRVAWGKMFKFVRINQSYKSPRISRITKPSSWDAFNTKGFVFLYQNTIEGFFLKRSFLKFLLFNVVTRVCHLRPWEWGC